MRSFNIDWQAFSTHLPTWDAISPRARKAYIDLKQGVTLPLDAMPADDAARLRERRLIALNAKGTGLRTDLSGSEFSKAMRAMSRHTLHARSDDRAMADYAADVLTGNERQTLFADCQQFFYTGQEPYYLAADIQWIQKFLDLPDARQALKWERARQPSVANSDQFADGSPYFGKAPLFTATRTLINTALQSPEPLRLSDLPAILKDVDASLLWRTLAPALRYFLLFASLDENFRPIIGIWPPLAHALHRPPATMPAPVEPRQTFHSPLLLHDMATVLVSASAEPLRLLADHDELYARSMERLAVEIAPMPHWLELRDDDPADNNNVIGFIEDPDDDDDLQIPKNRIDLAIAACRAHSLLTVKSAPRRQLQTTDGARAWLAMEAKERLRQFLVPWRQPKSQAKRRKTHPSLMPFLSYSWYDREDDSTPWLPQTLRWKVSRDKDKVNWQAAIVDALVTERPNEFFPVDDLLQYHARVNNPLLGRRLHGTYGPTPRLDNYYGPAYTAAALEDMWQKALTSFVMDTLLPLGAVEMAYHDQGHLFRLHSIGRYMLGLQDDFDFTAAPEGAVIIQPNFEVVFLGPSSRAEAILGPIAQRIGRGMGTLFRITRESITAVAAAGFDGEHVLTTLREVSSKPLPDNVARSIQGWFGATRHATLARAWIIEAPDEETAQRILATAGKSASLLGPTLIKIGTDKTHAALMSKLKNLGIFITRQSSKQRDDD